MPHDLPAANLLDEAVAAVACVLGAAVAIRHTMDAMPEDAAEIPDALPKHTTIAVGIRGRRKQQRMPALRAGVFRVPRPRADPLVSVMTQEARERVPDAQDTRLVLQARAAAARAAPRARRKDAVVDRVPP